LSILLTVVMFAVTLGSGIHHYKVHFQKMLRDVGMAVPKTTETRYGGGSVQARQGIQGLHK